MNETEEFLKGFKKLMGGFYPHEVFLPLKSYGVKHIHASTIKCTLACILLDYMGMKLTTAIVSSVLDIERPNAGAVMKGLGDKNVLNLLGYTGMQLTYEVHPNFKKVHRLNFDSVDKYVEKWNKEHD